VRENLSKSDTVLLVVSALLHDIGNPLCAVVENGRIRTPGHDVKSAELARDFLCFMDVEDLYDAPNSFTSKVCCLVREHMAHLNGPPSLRNARRLSVRLARHGLNMRMLALLVEADHSGRPPLAGGLPDEMARLLESAEAANVIDNMPSPLLTGKLLIAELGMTPGPHFRPLLDAA
jgi:hypothetical protein